MEDYNWIHYTINTMLMKSMTFIREINQWLSRFFRDSVETSLCSFGLGKVTNEIGFQGKITKRKYWFYLFSPSY
jgi:hypothetical protein